MGHGNRPYFWWKLRFSESSGRSSAFESREETMKRAEVTEKIQIALPDDLLGYESSRHR
jgi:hypothetical protein